MMTLGDRAAAACFILSMPYNQPYGVAALPRYVFEYIYEHGTLEDLPWIRMKDTDTEDKIYKAREVSSEQEIGRLCMKSPIMVHVKAEPFIYSLYHHFIGLNKFETEILKHLQIFKTQL